MPYLLCHGGIFIATIQFLPSLFLYACTFVNMNKFILLLFLLLETNIMFNKEQGLPDVRVEKDKEIVRIEYVTIFFKEYV